MPRYYDMDKLAEMAQTKADTLLPPGNIAFSSVVKWLDLLPAADVAPRAEVASEIFEEIEKIIEKHHSECYEYEDGDECDTAITYISYLSVDIAELKKKYQ